SDTSTAVSDAHCRAALDLASATPEPTAAGAGEGRLLVFVRHPDEQRLKVGAVSVHDLPGRTLVALDGPRSAEPAAPWCGWHVQRRRGAYRLRRAAPPGTGYPCLEQMIHTRAGWQTQVFLSARPRPAAAPEAAPPALAVSIVMLPGTPPSDFCGPAVRIG